MRDFLELTKPRITVLILICTAVGYFFGSPNSFHLIPFLHALLGTALMASGTAALNQWYEADSDSKMRRTSKRPIPAGRIRPSDGLVFRMLPVIEPDGESTARRVVACCLLLIPISLAPRVLGMTGPIYAATALAGG